MAVLLAGFGLAAYFDWTTRQVDDRLWQGLVAIGGVTGAIVVAPFGPLALALWIAVALLAVEQLVPWDLAVEKFDDRLPGLLEVAAFVSVGGFLGAAGWFDGIGPTGLPLLVIAAFASILLGRGLFEARLLYGGADAKALITTGVVLPIVATSWLALPDSATRILGIYPFALTLLMNAAIVAVGVPLSIALHNARRGDFSFPHGFTGFTIPVAELPDRFVWIKDPTFQRAEETETAEEDRAMRVRQRSELEAQGIARVWVTPQVPFLVLMFVGTMLGVVLGNLIFDVLAYV
ncbi:MAG: hypothetical protein L3J95_01590 [Thermoplasmata archaeon]|nr:hypothetical protein [Thermoplasmata archaeon]MCI4359106.1 hypothetical protein [Thermoplasmata archaeon]